MREIICSCGKLAQSAKDGLCVGCRGRHARQKCFWTPEQDELLKDAHRLARKEMSQALKRLMEITGFSRSVLYHRAKALRLCRNRKFWTVHEINFLRNHAGSVRIEELARLLGRSLSAVKNQLNELEILGRVREGYDLKSLAEFFGCDWRTVRRWEQRGLLRRTNSGKIGDDTLAKFLRSHPEEYDLRRVDQLLFKAIVFPEADCYAARIVGKEEASDSKEAYR